MHTATVSRREFLDIVYGAARNEPVQQRFDDLSSSDMVSPELRVVWPDGKNEREHSLPSAVVIPKDAQRDFLSWTYTYLSGLRPFTAFIRVVEPKHLEALGRAAPIRIFGRLSEAFVGLIIGEALSYLDVKPDARQLTSNACTNTHSYALTRALALGLENRLDDVSAAWSSVADLTRQTRRSLDPLSFGIPFRVVDSLYRNDPYRTQSLTPTLAIIRDACEELSRHGDIEVSTWRQLTNSLGPISELREQMSESRERRVQTFDRVWDWFASNRDNDPQLIGFVSGYLASRIAPGNLDHFGLAARMLPIAPTSLLWFSMCAGLQSGGQVFEFAEGLGRRIQRDLEQPDDLLGRPRCDLNVNELEILLDREKPLTDFRTGSSGLLIVELVPCVTTNIRWQRSGDVQAELFERRESSLETRELLRELSSALERVELIRRQLSRQLDPESEQSPKHKIDKRPKGR